jgi:hypothetical protein
LNFKQPAHQDGVVFHDFLQAGSLVSFLPIFPRSTCGHNPLHPPRAGEALRTQADLVDQLSNSSEKRLAQALLILSRFGKEGSHETVAAKISQETLAEMTGTTRSRVNFFMNKFRKLGFIKYNGGLQVNSSLLDVVLHD